MSLITSPQKFFLYHIQAHSKGSCCYTLLPPEWVVREPSWGARIERTYSEGTLEAHRRQGEGENGTLPLYRDEHLSYSAA
jgi:hypothetical protein